MTKCSPPQSDLPVQCTKPESSIHEVEITEVKIAEKLRSLKEHKSSGPDNIHVNVLKKTVPLLVSHSSSSSSFDSAGQRLTPHSRTLEVRPGRINKKF